jgi:hypothetical protein
MEIGHIPAGEAGVYKPTGLKSTLTINLERKKKLTHVTVCAAQFRCGRCGGWSALWGEGGSWEDERDDYRYGIDDAREWLKAGAKENWEPPLNLPFRMWTDLCQWKLHTKVWENLTEWVQFSSQRYVGLFLRETIKALLISTPSKTNCMEWSTSSETETVTAQVVKKFPTFFGTQKLISIFTRTCHWTVTWYITKNNVNYANPDISCHPITTKTPQVLNTSCSAGRIASICTQNVLLRILPCFCGGNACMWKLKRDHFRPDEIWMGKDRNSATLIEWEFIKLRKILILTGTSTHNIWKWMKYIIFKSVS